MIRDRNISKLYDKVVYRGLRLFRLLHIENDKSWDLKRSLKPPLLVNKLGTSNTHITFGNNTV